MRHNFGLIRPTWPPKGKDNSTELRMDTATVTMGKGGDTRFRSTGMVVVIS